MSAQRVSSLPGAMGAAKSACRARDNSLKRASWVTRLVLWSGVGRLAVG